MSRHRITSEDLFPPTDRSLKSGGDVHRAKEKKRLTAQPHRRKNAGDSASFFGVARHIVCPTESHISAGRASRVLLGGRSRRRRHKMEAHLTDCPVLRGAQSVKKPSLVRVVRPPENCTDQEKPQDEDRVKPPWSPGPTQIRYCGSVERKKDLPRHRSNRLEISIWVGPTDHPLFSPPPSGGLPWSVQKIGGRTTRTNVCEVIG